VVHFAGRKAVGESVSQPMLYYTHNVAAAVNLIEAMRKHSLKNVSGAVRRQAPSLSAVFCGRLAATESTLLTLGRPHRSLVVIDAWRLAAAELADVAPRWKLILHCMNLQMVFSSSATVYGNPEYTPLDEKHRLQVLSAVCTYRLGWPEPKGSLTAPTVPPTH
jgi:GDP-mannose 4,6 dehydratase